MKGWRRFVAPSKLVLYAALVLGTGGFLHFFIQNYNEEIHEQEISRNLIEEICTKKTQFKLGLVDKCHLAYHQIENAPWRMALAKTLGVEQGRWIFLDLILFVGVLVFLGAIISGLRTLEEGRNYHEPFIPEMRARR